MGNLTLDMLNVRLTLGINEYLLAALCVILGGGTAVSALSLLIVGKRVKRETVKLL
ncbi:MAG: hypothetical protein LBP79_00125 [Clostridiales bacterium]|jgi:hypothetical protein|nr:hypothetical protein [Clostridiales bacterium]